MDNIQSLAGILVGFLVLLLADIRRRRRKSNLTSKDAPLQDNRCQNCFFFKEFKRLQKENEKTTFRIKF